MLLGDMGADVVKIEAPRNPDPIRAQGTIVNGLSTYFAAFNRNKRSMTVDLRTEEGKLQMAALLLRARMCSSKTSGPACSRQWDFQPSGWTRSTRG